MTQLLLKILLPRLREITFYTNEASIFFDYHPRYRYQRYYYPLSSASIIIYYKFFNATTKGCSLTIYNYFCWVIFNNKILTTTITTDYLVSKYFYSCQSKFSNWFNYNWKLFFLHFPRAHLWVKTEKKNQRFKIKTT